MPDEDSSAVSEAMPSTDIYATTRAPLLTSLKAARAKLQRRGLHGLSTTDLVTLILGPRTESTVQLLVRRHGAAGLAGLSLEELSRTGRLGKAATSRMAAVLELHRRLKAMQEGHRPKLTKPREVHDQVKDIVGARKEHLIGLYLDAQNGLLHRETLSIGSLNTTRTHPREILYPAIEVTAQGFILSHNHPSGSLDPSPEDLEFTRSVQRAGELMGIELYDHVIVSVHGHASLRELGLL